MPNQYCPQPPLVRQELPLKGSNKYMIQVSVCSQQCDLRMAILVLRTYCIKFCFHICVLVWVSVTQQWQRWLYDEFFPCFCVWINYRKEWDNTVFVLIDGFLLCVLTHDSFVSYFDCFTVLALKRNQFKRWDIWKRYMQISIFKN